jgi:hypothetical protein
MPFHRWPSTHILAQYHVDHALELAYIFCDNSMRKYGFSFSWKRAIGLSAAKARLSRKIGIPLTRSGRQRKIGRMVGCLLPSLFFCLLATVGVSVLMALFQAR